MSDGELSHPHIRLVEILQASYYVVNSEVDFGPFKVDIYLPEHHLAIEVDGPHHGPKRDAKRDDYLREEFFLPTLHIKTDTVDAALEIIDDWVEEKYVDQAERFLNFRARLMRSL